MSQSWKLSPSDLTFLWDECPRCFYLKVVRNFRRPSFPFPKIFTRIDRLMKAHYENKPTSEISPDLPPGFVKFADKWVISQPISLPNHPSTGFIRGKFDSVIEFLDGSFAVIDFKTTQPKPEHVPFYSRQLQAYAYALEHPAPRGFKLSPISILGLVCVEPLRIGTFGEDQIAYIGATSWLECPHDEVEFLAFIDEVIAVLEQKMPPPAGPNCDYCKYRDKARMSGL